MDDAVVYHRLNDSFALRELLAAEALPGVS